MVIALVGSGSLWFGWYGWSLAWFRRRLVLDGTGVRVRLKRRCKFDFPWQDLAFVEVVRRPGGYSMSRPESIPALDEASRSVRPEQCRGVYGVR
ncbi:MAG: hypothetical protein QOH09_316 [Pseudonocardiales bacterium]|nr:hypothetical protein [Pseudonocardiales bacterium]